MKDDVNKNGYIYIYIYKFSKKFYLITFGY